MNRSRKQIEKIRQQGQKISYGMIKYVDKILRDLNLYAINSNKTHLVLLLMLAVVTLRKFHIKVNHNQIQNNK